MFRIIPLRTSLWRAGAVILALSFSGCYVGVSSARLHAPGFELAPPWDVRLWGVLAFFYAFILALGWWGASGMWSKWRQRGLAQPVEAAQAPSMHVRLTWTMMQVCGAVLVLAVGIVFSVTLAVAVPLGVGGAEYLLLARRVGKLEQERGVVYYWRRQPRIDDFQRTGVYAVPAYAALW